MTDIYPAVEAIADHSTAAAWNLRDQLAGQTVAGILSGGNCDLSLLDRVTGKAGQAPA